MHEGGATISTEEFRFLQNKTTAKLESLELGVCSSMLIIMFAVFMLNFHCILLTLGTLADFIWRCLVGLEIFTWYFPALRACSESKLVTCR
jgi:hypothetical protein